MAVWIVRLVGSMPAARCKTKPNLQRKAKRSWTVRRTMRQGVQDDSSQPQHTSAQQHALHSSIAPGQCCATFLFGQVGGRRKGGIFGNRQFWARAFLAGLSASFFEMRQKSHRLSSCQAVLATSRPARASVPLTKLQAVLAPHPRLAFELCPEKLDSRFGVSLCPSAWTAVRCPIQPSRLA
jgi:hypothetical protein